MTLKIAGLAIIYTITYRLYRRKLPRIRRRLGIALGKLNETTITLGLGRLSQVIVFAVTSFLTYFIAKHQQWMPWRAIFKSQNSPSIILSDNAPVLLAVLVFITSSAANAVRDRKQGGTYFGEFLSSYLIYRSITSDIIWTLIFNLLVLISLAFPFILRVFDTTDISTPDWSAVDIHTLLLSLWMSALTIVGIVLLFNFLSLLRQSMVHLFQPNQVKNEIRMDVEIDACGEIRSIFASREYDKDSLSSIYHNHYIEFWLNLPNREEQDEYFRVTVSSREWLRQQLRTSWVIQHRLLRDRKKWVWSYLQYPSLWISLTWSRIQEHKLEAFEQIMQGRHDTFVGFINSEISMEHRAILLRQMRIDSLRMDQLVRSSVPTSLPHDTQRGALLRKCGTLSNVDELPQSHPFGVVGGSSTFLFQVQQQDDSPLVVTLPAITYREIAKTVHNGHSPDKPLSLRYSTASLGEAVNSANSIHHEPTQRYALHCLVESLIDSLIINRHPEEQIPANELQTLIPGLYSHLSPPLFGTSSDSSSIPNPPAIDIAINCIKSRLKPVTPLTSEAYSELLKYVPKEEAAAAFLYMLLRTRQNNGDVSPDILRPFVSALLDYRIVSDDGRAVLHEAASAVLDRSSCVSHTLNESGLIWLLEILETPITASLYYDLNDRETDSYTNLDFTSLVLWRTLVGRRTYYGDYFIDENWDSLDERNVKKAILGAEDAAKILEQAGMEREADIIRSSLPIEESSKEQLQEPRQTASTHPFPHFHSRPRPSADRRLSNRQRRRLSRPNQYGV